MTHTDLYVSMCYCSVIPTNGVGQGKLFESGSCMTLTEVPNYLVPTQKHEYSCFLKVWFSLKAHVNISLLLFILGTLVLYRPISL